MIKHPQTLFIYQRFHCLVTLVWFLVVFFNHLARASNINIFGHQRMFDDIWSTNISLVARALKNSL